MATRFAIAVSLGSCQAIPEDHGGGRVVGLQVGGRHGVCQRGQRRPGEVQADTEGTAAAADPADPAAANPERTTTTAVSVQRTSIGKQRGDYL